MAVLSKQFGWRVTVKLISASDSECERPDGFIGAAFWKNDAEKVGGLV